MDLHLTDAADAPMLHDQEGDNIPWVDVKVTEAGNYRLQVHMVKCSAEPCYYRVGLYQRRTATQ